MTLEVKTCRKETGDSPSVLLDNGCVMCEHSYQSVTSCHFTIGCSDCSSAFANSWDIQWLSEPPNRHTIIKLICHVLLDFVCAVLLLQFPQEQCFIVSTNFAISQANQWYNLQGCCCSIERASVILCNDLRWIMRFNVEHALHCVWRYLHVS